MRTFKSNTETVVRTIVRKHIDTKKTYVFLFGSRASGNSQPASDFDIGFFGEERIPLAVLGKIHDELDDYPISVNVDLVDFSTVADDFKKIALRRVKIWNRPKKNFKLI